MIISALMSLFGSVIAGILGLMPHLSPPAWFSDATGALGTVTGALSGTSSWLPWNYLTLGVAVALLGVGLGAAIRGIRIVASFLTLGGGS